MPGGALFDQFAAWVAEDCRAGTRVLDIGAGASQFGYPAPIIAAGARYDGVDPSLTILANPYLAERAQMPIDRFAALHPESYNIALCVFVLEHVMDPAPFLAACARVLRPGGAFYALTPNRDHYFGFSAWAAARLGLEDRLLDRLLGKAAKDAYHVPVQYRLNTVPALRQGLGAAGFANVAFRCFDQPDRFTDYLPRGLKWFPALYARAVYRARVAASRGYLMGYLALRAELPGIAGDASPVTSRPNS